MKSLRNHRTPYVKSIRAMTTADIQYLREPATRPTLQRVRDAHINVCRLFSLGLRHEEIAARSGYSLGRIRQFSTDPSILEMVAQYRAAIDESFHDEVDFIQAQNLSNVRKASRQVGEHLDKSDEENELLPIRSLMSIISDGCDRFGYQKRSTTVNVNVDFAANLEKAISRSRKVMEVLG